MNPFALEQLSSRLVTHLDCTQERACQQILHLLAETGQPLAPTQLASRLQMNHECVMLSLSRLPDTELDEESQIVGWGITLVPTQHQFWVKGHRLFTWCAFDTETTSTGSAAFPAKIMNQFQPAVMEADSAKACFKLCDR